MNNPIIYKNSCTICGTSFTSTRPDKCYCPECNKLPQKKSVRKKKCVECDKSFEYNKKTAKYCSIKCSNAHKHKKVEYQYYRRMSVENTLKYLFWSTRFRSKKRKLSCTINENYLLNLLKRQNKRCAVTGVLLRPAKQQGHKDKNPHTISIDRINSKKGYIPGNIQLVTTIVNYCKNTYKMKDVKNMCVAYITHNKISTYGNGNH